MLSNGFAYAGLMKFFEEISAIPRASYKEEKIADYLCDFAEKRGLECYRDRMNNVLINAPATAGREGTPALLLQGHTDMVCEKNGGVEHDFDLEGLELYEQDGWIRAKGTTLGADDGTAVAVMLYILDGGVSSHGPLQCLFTASEEVGLDGAIAFDYSKIYARRMINMDGADETQLIAGCAGGVRTSVSFDVRGESITAPYLVKLSVRGLYGGHSGEDIEKGRANANKLMGRVLYDIMSDGNVRLVDLCGGSKENAIPRECEATLAVWDMEELKEKICILQTRLSDGLGTDDKNFRLELCENGQNVEIDAPDRSTAEKLIFVMRTVANGVFEMNNDIDGIVEWSRNLGVVRADSQVARLIFNSRSSFESRIDASCEELDAYARMLGGHSKHRSRYPGWSYAQSSDIRDIYLAEAEKIIGEPPKVTVTHAGLECGVIAGAIPDMDIISVGPLVLDLHSPDERLNKRSFERFYSIIKCVVEKY